MRKQIWPVHSSKTVDTTFAGESPRFKQLLRFTHPCIRRPRLPGNGEQSCLRRELFFWKKNSCPVQKPISVGLCWVSDSPLTNPISFENRKQNLLEDHSKNKKGKKFETDFRRKDFVLKFSFRVWSMQQEGHADKNTKTNFRKITKLELTQDGMQKR